MEKDSRCHRSQIKGEKQLTTYKELGELMRNLPTDETWLPLFLGRLKEKDPEIYRRMMELANDKLKEDK